LSFPKTGPVMRHEWSLTIEINSKRPGCGWDPTSLRTVLARRNAINLDHLTRQQSDDTMVECVCRHVMSDP
jgi:hypothetical protein